MSSCHPRQFGKSFDYPIKQLYLYVLKEKLILNLFINKNCKIMALEITDTNFEELVEKSDKPVLLDFWAEWCGPCRMVGPVVEELSKDYDGKAIVGKVNVDNNSAISAKFGIRNIPTILFFKGGQVVDKQVGAVQKSVLDAKLKALF